MGAEVARVERVDQEREGKPAGNAGGDSMMPKVAQKIDKDNLPAAPIQRQKNIPIETLIDLAETKKLSHSQIGKIIGCSAPNVTQRLQRAGITTLGNYKSNRADVIALVGKQILSSISDEDIKKASLNQKVVSYGILYDKERLERGQSTENVLDIHATIRDLKALRGGKVEGGSSDTPESSADSARFEADNVLHQSPTGECVV